MAALDIVNEKSTLMLTLAFKDEDGVAVIPSSATYRIDAPQEGLTILPATAISSLSSSVSLEITSAQNQAVSSAPYSERVVTVEFVYSLTKKGVNEYRYKLKNLTGVT